MRSGHLGKPWHAGVTTAIWAGGTEGARRDLRASTPGEKAAQHPINQRTDEIYSTLRRGSFLSLTPTPLFFSFLLDHQQPGARLPGHFLGAAAISLLIPSPDPWSGGARQGGDLSRDRGRGRQLPTSRGQVQPPGTPWETGTSEDSEQRLSAPGVKTSKLGRMGEGGGWPDSDGGGDDAERGTATPVLPGSPPRRGAPRTLTPAAALGDTREPRAPLRGRASKGWGLALQAKRAAPPPRRCEDGRRRGAPRRVRTSPRLGEARTRATSGWRSWG